MKIGVVGLGKLGLPLSVLLSKQFQVFGVDLNPQRVQQVLNREKFVEPKLSEYLDEYGCSLKVSSDYAFLKGCEVVFIITQTPSLPSGKFDIQYVESALRQAHRVNPDCLVVVSSTINIGDMDKLQTIHKRIAYNPEFIKQGSIIHDFQNPKFVLIGAYTQEDSSQVANIWKSFHDKPICIVKPVEAEIIKLSLNVSFTLGITFANAIGELCRKFNADSSKVLDIIYRDHRNYKAGLGAMGPCFPRDLECFRAISHEKGVETARRFAAFIKELNAYTLDRYVQEIKNAGKKSVGFLGVAYKLGVPYVYESQPLEIARRLLKEGYEIHIYDPLAEQNARQILNCPNVHFHPDLGECVRQSDVLFIGTLNYSKVVVDPWK